MPPLLPPQWEARAVQFLTQKLLQSPTFVGGVQAAHRKALELKEQWMQAMLPPQQGDEPAPSQSPPHSSSSSYSQPNASHQSYPFNSSNSNDQRWRRDRDREGTQNKNTGSGEEGEAKREKDREELERILQELRNGRK
ncbi:hypothetical protein BT69DRAFT_1334106 [Atractiella rhizophila]|nr:hypothetical protein BT69DRAFT_1334106 [Atractiella rhizophila]